MYDPHSREPRGFGFVTMETADGADAAIASIDGVELLGRTLKVQRVSSGAAVENNCRNIVIPFCADSRLVLSLSLTSPLH